MFALPGSSAAIAAGNKAGLPGARLVRAPANNRKGNSKAPGFFEPAPKKGSKVAPAAAAAANGSPFSPTSGF